MFILVSSEILWEVDNSKTSIGFTGQLFELIVANIICYGNWV